MKTTVWVSSVSAYRLTAAAACFAALQHRLPSRGHETATTIVEFRIPDAHHLDSHGKADSTLEATPDSAADSVSSGSPAGS